ncbi:hypothetical protein [Streptomyces laurentii]|uniref:hypothetical protein n=1 Tax=Streptomyces laurentii TaxID=39478 RepID=UPI0036CFA16B
MNLPAKAVGIPGGGFVESPPIEAAAPQPEARREPSRTPPGDGIGPAAPAGQGGAGKTGPEDRPPAAMPPNAGQAAIDQRTAPFCPHSRPWSPPPSSSQGRRPSRPR